MDTFLNQCDEHEGDDTEVFLNRCEDDVEGGDDDDDGEDDFIDYGASAGEAGALGTRSGTVDDAIVELEALERFQSRLLELAGVYDLQKDDFKELLSIKCKEESPVRYFTAILIQSELRTLQFFLLAADRAVQKLNQTEDTREPESLVDLQPDGKALMDKQVDELVGAYLKI